MGNSHACEGRGPAISGERLRVTQSGLDFSGYGSGTSGSLDRRIAGFAPDWRVWTEVTDIRDRIAAVVRPSSCAVCGVALMRIETGRPRLVCSLRCRRMRDNTLRLIRRRRAWLESWHRAARYHTAEAARAIAQIECEIGALEATMARPLDG